MDGFQYGTLAPGLHQPTASRDRVTPGLATWDRLVEPPLHVHNDRPRTQSSARGLVSASCGRPRHVLRAANAQGRGTFPLLRAVRPSEYRTGADLAGSIAGGPAQGLPTRRGSHISVSKHLAQGPNSGSARLGDPAGTMESHPRASSSTTVPRSSHFSQSGCSQPVGYQTRSRRMKRISHFTNDGASAQDFGRTSTLAFP
jgi:hypothetical protein